MTTESNGNGTAASAVEAAGDAIREGDGRWQKGVSGNPAGRPKGTRNKLETKFIRALLEDFNEHGLDAIRNMRQEAPADYIYAIIKILPRQVQAEIDLTTGHEEALRQLA